MVNFITSDKLINAKLELDPRLEITFYECGYASRIARDKAELPLGTGSSFANLGSTRSASGKTARKLTVKLATITIWLGRLPL